MKRTNWAILMVIALEAMVFSQVVQARPEVINDVVTFDSGSTLNVKGTLKIQDTTVTATAAELNATEGRLDVLEATGIGGTLTPGYIIVGNASTSATAVAVSGDITIITNGTVAIASGVIVNADVKTNAAIVSTKLSGVAAAPSVAGSVSGTTNTVTITAKDGASATIAATRLVRVWMSEASGGVPSTNNIESLTLSGGTAIQTITAAAHYIYVTGTNGTASAVVIGTAAGTNYLNVADGGYVSSASVVFQ